MSGKEMIPFHYLLTYRFCKRKLYLEEALGLADPARVVRTRILDDALRYTNKLEEGIVRGFKGPMAKSKVIDAFRQSASRSLQEAVINQKEAISEAGVSIIDTSKDIWSLMQRYIRMRAEHVYDFMVKHRVYGSELWWQLSPKMSLKLPVDSSTLDVSVVIDRVDRYKTSSVPFVFSYKNAPEEGLLSNDRLKLTVATIALADNGAAVPNSVALYNNGLVRREFVITPESKEWVERVIEGVISVLSSSVVPDKLVNPNACERCSLRDKCFDESYVQSLINVKLSSLSRKAHHI